MTRLPLAAALLLTTALPLAAQDAPVRAVTLFEAGLAELTRETGSAAEVTLRVPLRDVNDVLKSLLVRGAGITGARIALDGQTPVEDAFASLPFPPAAATDLPTLLRSVPGIRVRVVDSAFPEGREGTVMGVAQDCGTETGCEDVLTVVGDDGAVRRHALGPGTDLVILDQEIAQALARGLAALRGQASGTVREVQVTMEGAPEDGALTYVVAAPAWKTAYRALTAEDGAVDLQAWAVIENATGEDWEDVALTLSSGSPVTLAADLHGRDWRYRPVATPEAAPVPAPMPMAREAEQAALGAAAVADMAESFAAPAPVIVAEPAASASEGVLDSRFAFDAPVDLAAGEMLSLPFLGGAIGAEHYSLWSGQGWTRSGNPDLVMEVTNDLTVRLPAGIMTVSDATGGYVGDADFPLVAPGASEVVTYGTDRRLTVEETASETTRQLRLTAARGVVRIASEDARETTYLAASPAGEARDLVIAHPLEQGWTTAVVAAPEGTGGGEVRQDEDGSRWLRLAVTTPGGGEAGQEGEVKLVLRDTYPVEQVVQVGSLDVPAILAYAGQAGDEASRAYLEEAAALAREAADARDALARAEAAQRGLAAEQDRTRVLLGSVENPSAAYDRFLAQLLALEDRIGEAAAATEAARAEAEAADAALARHLEG